jgi:hypothetical protein
LNSAIYWLSYTTIHSVPRNFTENLLYSILRSAVRTTAYGGYFVFGRNDVYLDRQVPAIRRAVSLPPSENKCTVFKSGESWYSSEMLRHAVPRPTTKYSSWSLQWKTRILYKLSVHPNGRQTACRKLHNEKLQSLHSLLQTEQSSQWKCNSLGEEETSIQIFRWDS